MEDIGGNESRLLTRRVSSEYTRSAHKSQRLRLGVLFHQSLLGGQQPQHGDLPASIFQSVPRGKQLSDNVGRDLERVPDRPTLEAIEPAAEDLRIVHGRKGHEAGFVLGKLRQWSMERGLAAVWTPAQSVGVVHKVRLAWLHRYYRYYRPRRPGSVSDRSRRSLCTFGKLDTTRKVIAYLPAYWSPRRLRGMLP
jgi:hypothetical protein